MAHKDCGVWGGLNSGAQKESREEELNALVAPEVRAALERNGIELVNYGGLR